MDTNRSTRTFLATALATSLLAAAIAAPATAANPENVAVTGQSTSTITLTISDTTAAFGTNLTPDGQASNAEGVVVATVAGGTCYDWAGTATVSSNVAYDVEVVGDAANANLDWMGADPATYAACTGGTQVGTVAADLVTNQAITSSTDHSFWLGLDVKWSDGVSATLGTATLTFTAVANA